MSSVRPVPETELMGGGELSADDAWHTVRRHRLGHLLTAAFLRFRYGDGFSHARAFALQLALAAVPLAIAGAGLAAALGAESFAEVVAPPSSRPPRRSPSLSAAPTASTARSGIVRACASTAERWC